MKFFKFRKFFTIILFLTISLPVSWAQGNRDFMRETARNFCETAQLLQGAMRNGG